jgi:hypothetical protein
MCLRSRGVTSIALALQDSHHRANGGDGAKQLVRRYLCHSVLWHDRLHGGVYGFDGCPVNILTVLVHYRFSFPCLLYTFITPLSPCYSKTGKQNYQNSNQHRND